MLYISSLAVLIPAIYIIVSTFVTNFLSAVSYSSWNMSEYSETSSLFNIIEGSDYYLTSTGVRFY